MSLPGRVLVLVAIAAVLMQGEDPKPHELLNSTLWAQQAVEHDAAYRQAYRQASRQLDRAVRKKAWTAAIEQTGKFQRLPPAVILDLDETVLDNSPEQARTVLAGGEWDQQRWNRWVGEARATALPGALEFLQYAAQKKVAIFFITNRAVDEEAATRRNLESLGISMESTEDRILCKGERPDWTSDKSTRRRLVAQRFRILLLIGDDLGDFLGDVRTSTSERRQTAQPYAAYWGDRWIMLPNAMYGSWETSLTGNDPAMSREVRMKRKLGALDARLAEGAAP